MWVCKSFRAQTSVDVGSSGAELMGDILASCFRSYATDLNRTKATPRSGFGQNHRAVSSVLSGLGAPHSLAMKESSSSMAGPREKYLVTFGLQLPH